ncbi:hypothetical protein SAMN04487771_10735 [[Clostridium] aminophilum]|uniref:Uncharacterized protein n=1 Tax=[Clostridium] aminophilum TaxID=1526 RepID=A0A1I0I9G0_9FIRM|nr:hypothetical protein [[Clostridium] aminophilum]SET93229.1 hypothetical protein SAMN04487771_10735 [[Clostridium] aminophilum]
MNQIYMPNSYKGTISAINSLICKGNRALGKPNESGIIQTIIFVDEIVELHETVAMKLGEMRGKVMQLKNNHSKKLGEYEMAIEKLTALEEELADKLKKIGKGNF